ncbi:MAG TPA: hypothetical protein VET87_10055 [Rubrivivax sp.]|nr:hypothetical protein [Rubrivivax sp.]
MSSLSLINVLGGAAFRPRANAANCSVRKGFDDRTHVNAYVAIGWPIFFHHPDRPDPDRAQARLPRSQPT